MNMFRAIAILLAVLLASTPTYAQWQTQNHSVPIGRGAGVTGFDSATPSTAEFPLVSNGPSGSPTFSRRLQPAGGGTGLDNSASVTNDILTYNGSGFIHSAFLTVVNAVCTALPGPCASLFGYMLPQWFGAAGDCVTNDQAAGVAAIAAAVAAKTTLMFNKPCYAHSGVWEMGFNNFNVRFSGDVTIKELGATINVSIDAGPGTSDFLWNVQFGRDNPPYLTGNTLSLQNLFVRGITFGSVVEARGGDASPTTNDLEVSFAVGAVLRLIVNGNGGAVPLITSKPGTAILLRHRNNGEPISGCQIYVIADSMVNGVVMAGVNISNVTGFSENNSTHDLFMQTSGTDGNDNNVITDFDIEGIGSASGLTLDSGNFANTFVGLSMGNTKNVLIQAGNHRNNFYGGHIATLTDNGNSNAIRDAQVITFNPNMTTIGTGTSWFHIYDGAGVYYADRLYAPSTVATLPACNAIALGGRAFVVDATAALTAGIGTIVAGGAANKVPVECDGVNWRIG